MSKISLASQGLPQEEVINQLKEFVGEIPYKGKETFLNTPVLIGKSQMDDYQQLTKILQDVLISFALNYTNDEKLQGVYLLDEFLISVLNTANTVLYKTGMSRPDFIYDANGQPKICEIGCRYPMNGWLLSHYLNDITDNLANKVDSNWSSIPNKSSFLTDFQNEFNAEEPIFLVHESGKGPETNYLKDELAKNNVRLISVSPKEITFVDDKLMAKGELATQFLLELDREELRLFEPTVLREVITKGRCINDVRSIILLHDKRFLSALFDQNLMPRYISGPDYEFLAQFLIPTYTLNSKVNKNALLEITQNWILKSNSGGDGTGVYVKDECSPEVWKDIITNHWQKYMAQPYIEQKKFTLKEGDESREINLAGSLLCFNGNSYGLGFFRGSSESLINLYEGNSVILPCVLDTSIE